MDTSSADTAKTAQGFISMKAYRLTPEAIKMFKENDFSPDYVKVKIKIRCYCQSVKIRPSFRIVGSVLITSSYCSP